MTRVCSKCGVEKPVEEFHQDRRKKTGRKSRCRECLSEQRKLRYDETRERDLAGQKRWRDSHKEYLKHKRVENRGYYRDYRERNREKLRRRQKDWSLQAKYGITLQDRDVMYLSQNGCCAVCGDPVCRDKMVVDHDHNTGEVRELLCYRCNTMLGYVEAYPHLVLQAQAYVERHKQ